jgi:hypothetical protein
MWRVQIPTAYRFADDILPDDMVRLSGWVRDQNAKSLIPVQITPATWSRVVQMRLPALRERAWRVLVRLAKDFLDRPFDRRDIAADPALQAGSYSTDEAEVDRLIRILID